MIPSLQPWSKNFNLYHFCCFDFQILCYSFIVLCYPAVKVIFCTFKCVEFWQPSFEPKEILNPLEKQSFSMCRAEPNIIVAMLFKRPEFVMLDFSGKSFHNCSVIRWHAVCSYFLLQTGTLS